MKKTPMKRVLPFILILMVCVGTAHTGYTQATVVFADPALGSVDITTTNDQAIDANALFLNGIYKVKLDVFNFNFTNAIPVNTAYVELALGSKFVIDPAFNLSNAPLNNYFTFSYITGSQAKIRCEITNPLPADFIGQLVFNVQAKTPGVSFVTGNFFVSNNNPAFTLSDESPGNNNASLQYTITTVMPVTISNFTAKNKNCELTVGWNAGQEINVAGYDIEISRDGNNFAKCGYVSAENKNSYSILIPIPEPLKNYSFFVRLKSKDKDGKFAYTPIVTVDGNCGSPKHQVYCFPNPITSENEITIATKESLFKGQYQVSVIDASGKQYMVKQVKADSLNSFKLPVNNSLSAGTYFIVMHGEDQSFSMITSFVKE